MADSVKKKHRLLNQDGTSNILKPKTYTHFQDLYHRVLGAILVSVFSDINCSVFFREFFICADLFFSGTTGTDRS